MTKPCEVCLHPVGGGGNRHAKDNHPPMFKGPRSERRRRKYTEARRRNGKGADFRFQRGVAVAGVGGSKAASHRKKNAIA